MVSPPCKRVIDSSTSWFHALCEDLRIFKASRMLSGGREASPNSWRHFHRTQALLAVRTGVVVLVEAFIPRLIILLALRALVRMSRFTACNLALSGNLSCSAVSFQVSV